MKQRSTVVVNRNRLGALVVFVAITVIMLGAVLVRTARADLLLDQVGSPVEGSGWASELGDVVAESGDGRHMAVGSEQSPGPPHGLVQERDRDRAPHRAGISPLAARPTAVAATDPAATADVITLPDAAGNVGFEPTIALDASGNPVISYYDATDGDLKVLHCDDPNCAGTETPTSPDHIGTDTRKGLSYSSIALDASGNPVISYYDINDGDLKVLHCDDPNCAGAETPTSPDIVGDFGGYPSMVLDAAGNPVISYHDATNLLLKVLHCDDPNCAGTETPTSPDTVPFIGQYSSLVLDAAGNPVISYHDGALADRDLKVLHCDDPNCAGTETPTSPDTAGDVGQYSSLVLDAAGNPVISYWSTTNSDLRVLHCDDPNCAGTETPTSPDTAGDVGFETSIVLDVAGNPVVAYRASGSVGSDLKVLHCDDPNCEAALPPATSTTSVPPTTTTSGATPTTTMPAATTTQPIAVLPETGSSDRAAAMIGALLFTAGATLALLGRRDAAAS